MPKPIWHDGGYWHRKRVPVDIRATYPKREEWEPLRTKDIALAKRRIPDAMKAVMARFDAHRKSLNVALPSNGSKAPPNGSNLPRAKEGFWFGDRAELCAYYRETWELNETHWRVATTERVYADPEAFWRGEIVTLPPNVTQDGLGHALHEAYRGRLERLLKSLKGSLAIRDLSLVQTLAASRFDGELDADLLVALARAHIKFIEEQLADDTTLYPDAPLSSPPALPTSSVSQSNPLLSTAAALWSDQRKDWTKDRRAFFIAAWTLLVEVVGDKPPAHNPP